MRGQSLVFTGLAILVLGLLLWFGGGIIMWLIRAIGVLLIVGGVIAVVVGLLGMAGRRR